MNIYEMAEENIPNLSYKFNEIKRKHTLSSQLKDIQYFSDAIKKEGTISINISQKYINLFLITGVYQNVYDRKKEGLKVLSKVGVKTNLDEGLRSHLKGFYTTRVLFDQLFHDYTKVKYGALYLSGSGINKYGKYCMVLKRDLVKKFESIVYVMGDSLLDYVHDNNIDTERLKNDVSDKEHFHMLATIKHEKDIEGINFKKCGSMICNNDSYIEVAIEDDITVNHIDSVKIKRKDYDKFFDILFKKEFSNEKVDEMDDIDFTFLSETMFLLEKLNIGLEVDGDENDYSCNYAV